MTTLELVFPASDKAAALAAMREQQGSDGVARTDTRATFTGSTNRDAAIQAIAATNPLWSAVARTLG